MTKTPEELREANRQYVLHWKRIGPILEGIQFWETRRESYADRAKALERILASAPAGEGNGPEGWIEWQKLKERWLALQTSRSH